MAYKYAHLYSGAFKLFESELSRTIAGCQPSEHPDLWLPPSGFDYEIADDGRFNASARRRKTDGTGVYKFFLGLQLGIIDSVCTLACTEGFFNELPFDRDVHEVDVGEIPDRYIDYRFLFEQASYPGPVISKYLAAEGPVPVDESPRGRLGNHLMETCLRFVSYHEQAHYLLGHVDMARRDFGVRELYEVQPPENTGSRLEDAQLSRVLEIHADANAVGSMLSIYPGKKHFKETKRGVWLPNANDPRIWAKSVIVSIGIVSSIINLAETRWVPDSSARSHPHALTRLLSAIQYADGFLHEFFPDKESRDRFMMSIESDLNFVFSFFGIPFLVKVDTSKEEIDCSNETISHELNNLRKAVPDVVKLLKAHEAKKST